jgi:hypothetical protein
MRTFILGVKITDLKKKAADAGKKKKRAIQNKIDQKRVERASVIIVAQEGAIGNFVGDWVKDTYITYTKKTNNSNNSNTEPQKSKPRYER